MPPLPELHYFDRTLEGPTFPAAQAVTRLSQPAQLASCVAQFRQRAQHGDVSATAWWAMHEFLDRDDEWYRLLFSPAPSDCLVGEITPRYAICGDAEIAHMHAVAPAAKLLFLLRHPVDRFWSQCKMIHKSGGLLHGDPAAMQLFDSSNGRSRGEYTATIARFCRHYDPSQILVVFHDAIAREPQVVLRGIFAFLGLPDRPLEDTIVSEPVNQSADRRAIPHTLRTRIDAAYRAEIETLADIFGGYATHWLEGTTAAAAPAVLRLEPGHVEAIRRRPARVRASRTRDPIKIFCLSMQRNGTTSVGDWLEAHGLTRAGSPTSVRLGWTRRWLAGRFEDIYATPEFQAAEILEDDPWWCPGFHRELAVRFPEARFVLLTRDPSEWFDSLCHHSGGMNPGWTDVHARIYDRDDDLQALLRSRPGTDPATGGLLSIVEHSDHYKEVYNRHTAEVLATFAATPDRLFHARLDDTGSFHDLCDFVGVRRNPTLAVPRSNARTEAMRLQLAARVGRDAR